MIRLFFIHTFAFAYRNFIFAKRNVFTVVEMLFWPIMTVLSVGLMGSFLSLEENTLAFVMTGAVASGVLQVTQLDVSYSLMYDLWSKSVKHTFLTPAGITPALMGAWIVGVVRGAIVLAMLVFMSERFFDFSLPGILSGLVFAFGIFWMSLLAGICVWVLILLYGQRAEISVWALSYVIMLLSGIYYPVDLLPEPFFTLAKLVPLTYFLDAFRSHYGFPLLFPYGIWKGLFLSLLYTFIGVGCIKLAVSKARNSGLLLQLSE